MSVSTTKLDYARIRNAQRKINKSLQDVKDVTDIQNNGSAENLVELNQPKDQEPKGINGSDNKGGPLNSNNDFLNIFGPNFYAGNLEYINSLIVHNNKSARSMSGREQSNKKTRNHKRAKSSLMESSQKSKLKQGNDENIEPSPNSKNTQNIENIQASSGAHQASSLIPDLDNEKDSIQVGNKKEMSNFSNLIQRDPISSTKEERLFGKFFEKGGFGRRSMSLEDLRLEKKGGADDEKRIERGMEEIDQYCEKSSEKSSRSKLDSSIPKNFIANLDNYIRYFDKSDIASQRSKHTSLKKYFLGGEQKENQFMRKEIETLRKESKGLKKHIEALQSKMLELVKINKHFMRELNEARSKEEEYEERMKDIEKQFLQVKQRKKYYKGKLIQMQELLELERINNENNIAVLKKMLASNINNGLDNRTVAYTSNGREKPNREKDYLKSVLKDLSQQQKREREQVSQNIPKEKKTSNTNLVYNNRYDMNMNKKMKASKEPHKYSLSLLSQKADMRSEDEDEDTIPFENQTPSESYIEMDTSDQQEMYQDIYAGEKYEKKLAKDYQIKYLHGKLVQLIGEQPNIDFYEENTNQRSQKKTKQKVLDQDLQNYITLRERKASYIKASQGPLKSDYQLKTKIKSDIENNPPLDGMNYPCYSTNKSD